MTALAYARAPARSTYQRPLQVILALPELFQRVLLVQSTLHNLGHACLADIFQDGLHLALGGGVLGDVELELIAVGSGLV